MSDPTTVQAIALLDRVRALFGVGPSGLDAGEAILRAQLAEAYPLLSLMVARLEAHDSDEERADVRHNWQKALRRRGWDALPPIDGRGPAGSMGASSAPPAMPAGIPSPASQACMPHASDRAPSPGVSDAEPADLAAQVGMFLAMFGVAIDPRELPLAMWPRLGEVLAVQLPLAQRLRAGPLLAPSSYARAYREAVDPWNDLVGHSALRIPD